MRLTRFTDIARFSRRVEPFLLANEAAHCLQLGLIATLLRQPDVYSEPPYLATVATDAAGQAGNAGDAGDAGNADDAIVAVALRTPPHNVVISLIADPAHIAPANDLFARDLLAVFGPRLRGLLASTAIASDFAARWQATSGQYARPGLRERVYQLSAVLPVTGVSGHLRRATPADRDLLIRWSTAFNEEALAERSSPDTPAMVDRMLTFIERGAYLWDDGQPVAFAAYNGPTPHGMRIGPVYTPPELRGHGYASACVAGLSQRLLDEGRHFTFLFTNLANPTANHIYQQIGYTPVCDMDEYLFDTTT